jgi:hypothetical protein
VRREEVTMTDRKTEEREEQLVLFGVCGGVQPSWPIGTSRTARGQRGRADRSEKERRWGRTRTQGPLRVRKERPEATHQSEAPRAKGSREGREKWARGPTNRAE